MSKLITIQPFREQYYLTINSEIKTIDTFITSSIEFRYDFQVIDITDVIEARLITLEHKVIRANNPMVEEVAQMSKIFGKVYNELHLLLSHEGKVLKILNTDLILSKWESIKNEIKTYVSEHPNLEQAIIMNDNIFNNPDKIKVAVQANEFFSVYFGFIFNEEIPLTKKVLGTNIFNTANINWILNTNENNELSSKEEIKVITEAHPIRPFPEGFINTAYRYFKDNTTIISDEIKMYQREERSIERASGKVNEVFIKKVEDVVTRKLYQKFSYKMISDTQKKKAIEKNKNSSKVTEQKENNDEISKPTIYKVVNGKELTYEEWKMYEQQQWEAYQQRKKKKGFWGF